MRCREQLGTQRPRVEPPQVKASSALSQASDRATRASHQRDAIDLIAKGAYDYLQRPVDQTRLRTLVGEDVLHTRCVFAINRDKNPFEK